MAQNDNYTIRPAGRHLLTIGRDLIQDQYAAIVELVKNAYDADSPDVRVVFCVSDSRNNITITIKDHGHGMSRNVVINSWLVPSTDDKLKRKFSPKGRTMQGRKGVGRYATSILGDDLLLETITSEGEKTNIYVQWEDFEKATYLDDVEVLVETSISKVDFSGTTLTITGNQEHLEQWDDKQIQKLRFELKKLIPPVNQDVGNGLEDDNFEVILEFKNFWTDDNKNITERIEPYPIFQLFDYKISGRILSDGKATLEYVNQRAKNTIKEKLFFTLRGPTGCGDLYVDIRVYDREREAIEQLIKRGLKDEQGNYVGKLQARQLLNQYNGIGVYRNGFRIRPLGDPDFDWLKLNEQRIQNPSLRIGNNQVIGYVQIQAEELSGLEEKSARDGLRENSAYEKLKGICGQIVGEIETRRFDYRRKAGLSRNTLRVERQLERLFEFDDLKQGIRSKLLRSGVGQKEADEIIEIIGQKEQENNQIAEELSQAVAIYQGQATLGKIINVVLHEGRRPLNYFKNQIPNLQFWASELKKGYEEEILEEIIPIANGLGENAESFVVLFSRLDPLAAKKRAKKREFNICDTVNKAFRIFETNLIEKKITYKVNCEEITIFGWEQDVIVILTNLIDNSVFWMNEKPTAIKKIEVTIHSTRNKFLHLDYRDTGPGIEKYLIESQVIFEPEFSTKNDGTGLGLAIAGEAASRNGLELKAYESNTGAYFRLLPFEDKVE